MATLGDDELLGRSDRPLPPAADGAPYDLVLLDRDGTLNAHRPGYVDRPEDLVMLPGAGEAVRRLGEVGARLVLISNQRGIATGALTWDQLLRVQRALVDRLAAAGGHLDAVRICPHEKDTCRCRKPMPGLFEQALSLAPWARPERCVMIGDQPSDVSPATSLGMAARRIGQDGASLLEVVQDLLGPKPDLGRSDS